MTFYHTCAIPKPKPRALVKKTRDGDTDKLDRVEKAKCRKRSGGRCEVVRVVFALGERHESRCSRAANDNHHLIGGSGRRNVGDSILAKHRIEVCRSCHQAITRHLLVPYGAHRELARKVRYEVVR